MFENNKVKKERVYIVCPYTSLDNADYRTKELEQLAESALLEIVKTNCFLVKEINAKTYLGIGKVEEIAKDVENLNADVVLFDCPLTGSQLRNLNEIV